VRKVESILKDHNAYGSTFWEIGEHAPVAGIREGIDAFKSCGADIIVAVGGGSPIDASKVILLNLQREAGGPYAKQIAIPTTLSAAEYTYVAGYTDDEGNKVGVNSPELAPAGIILDSELTLSTPERLWLSTGIRALDHAIEGLYRPGQIPPLKTLFYRAAADLFEYLPKSKADPENVTVRQKLQLASWMSMWPIKMEKLTGLGLSHSLGYKLGATYGISHGITSCLTLGPTVGLEADIASQEDKEWLAGALFYLQEPSTGTVEGDVRKLSEKINQLVADLGLKSSLAEYKVPKEDLHKIAAGALGSESDPSFPKVYQVLAGMYDTK